MRALVPPALALLAAAANLLTERILGGPTLMWPVVAITLAALHGGTRAGLVGAALTIAAHAFFIVEPRGSLGIARGSDVYRVLVLAAVGSFMAWVAGQVRSAMGRARRERARAQANAERLALSHRLVAALASASTEDEVSKAIFERGFSALGARTMLIARRVEPDAVMVVKAFGFPEAAGDAWRRVGATAELPYAHAVACGEPIWIESFEELERRYPAAAPVVETTGAKAWACVPTLNQGRATGSFCIGFSEARTFGDFDRRFIESLAATCGQALSRAQLYESERAARLRAETAEAEAKRIGELQERLVAVVSHDLRNPLAAIISGLDLLLRLRQLDERQVSTIHRTLASALRMDRLIRDLLDFTRARRSLGIPTQAEQADLQEIVRRAVLEIRMAHPGAEILVDVQGQVEAACDPARIEQAVSNLLANAVQHGNSSEVRVRVRGADSRLSVEVENQGKHIPAERLSRLFEPFAQEDPSAGHLGLGLFIVREIAAAHGGTVSVRSTPEGVTTFALELPRTTVGSTAA